MLISTSEQSIYHVHVWFLSPVATLDPLEEGCLAPLCTALRDHTPPFHQYLDEDDQPLIQDELVTVAEIGNGMYKRNPKVKPSGKLSNRTGTVSYHTLPKVVTWNSIMSFHITQGVPIVRDMQYTKGLHIGVEADWHRIYLQRMPSMKSGGEFLQPSHQMKNTCMAGIRLTRDANGAKEAIPEPGSTIIVEFSNADTTKRKPHERNQRELYFGRVDTFGGKSFLEKTNTDFCVLLTMPRNHRFPLKNTSMLKPDHESAAAKLRFQ